MEFKEFVLSQPGEIVPQDQFIKLFGNIDVLKGMSDVLLKDLQDRYTDWKDDTSQIGDVMVRVSPMFRLFSSYAENFEENFSKENVLQKLRDKYPKFKEATEDFHKKPNLNGQQISSLFLEPVQRLTRYKILLEAYIKRLTVRF